MAKTARDEGFEEVADWFDTLAMAEKSHAGRFKRVRLASSCVPVRVFVLLCVVSCFFQHFVISLIVPRIRFRNSFQQNVSAICLVHKSHASLFERAHCRLLNPSIHSCGWDDRSCRFKEVDRSICRNFWCSEADRHSLIMIHIHDMLSPDLS